MKRLKKRWIFLAVLLLLVLFWLGNLRILVTTRVELTSDKIADPVTIVHLTDLHGAVFGRDNARLIDRVAGEEPDLIAVTGDMYTYGDAEGQARALALLAALTEVAPVYYVNGEHDNSAAFRADLTAAGVHVLDYETADVTIGETRLTLYGINNVYYSPTFDLSNAFTLDESRYNILLAHSANVPAFRRFGLDLALCGDTHGGQVRLPFVGAVYNSGVWFPERSGSGAQYTKGLYPFGSFSLFLSSGLGTYPVPVRLFDLPEIAVITLR